MRETAVESHPFRKVREKEGACGLMSQANESGDYNDCFKKSEHDAMTDANPSMPVLNKKALAKLASTLLQEVTTQKTHDGAQVEALIRQSDTLFKAARRVSASHSGSNFGYHGSLYYRDFEVPPMGSMFNVKGEEYMEFHRDGRSGSRKKWKVRLSRSRQSLSKI